MQLPFRDTLLPKLRAAFPDAPMLVGAESEPLVVFSAKHAEVGDLVIQDEGDELTLVLGSITHRHFGNQDPQLGPNEQAEQIATEVTEYLRGVFADEIEFYGNGGKGGARKRSNKKRGFLSKVFLGSRTFLWSGPLDQSDA